MFGTWTFGRRLAAAFALAGLILVVIAALAFTTTATLIRNNEELSVSEEVHRALLDILSAVKDAETGQRGFVIAGAESYLQPYVSGTQSVNARLADARTLLTEMPKQRQRLDAIEALIETRLDLLEQGIGLRRREGLDAAVRFVVANDGREIMNEIRDQVTAATDEVKAVQAERDVAARASADRAMMVVSWGGLLGTILVGAIGWFITRSLSTQIGSAVGHVQSSSAELHSAASQQATGVKEQVTSMSEINTTINELLATSRQIAESAQRVAQISEQTTTAARSGDGTVERANDSISEIRRQVDLVVGHMLELGKKSQQIGAVLDIVTELAEQTNILSINATIEAAGAGESGKRFSVVADEIRKLADRVAGSAKEIRALIDDMRSSVNTTVMATETGSKAVDAGSRQFGEVATVFKDIAKMVGTTTEAAREIELSTKQQATAVEQVNMAIANVAQATKETEASAGQTIQTASELANTSRSLLRLVQSESAA